MTDVTNMTLSAFDVPITTVLPEILQAVQSVNQIILQAPTGAGKSTALPLALLQSGLIKGKILMLEPRRVATRNIAKFIAKQLQQPVGQQVGYRVRGDSQVSANTQLEVVTEGILTRMIQDDPELAGVDMIIFDEIHERHLPTDIGLALALEVQSSLRDDLIILAMSATLSALPLQDIMPNAQVVFSDGRSFPVDVEYVPMGAATDWLSHMAKVIAEWMNISNSHSRERGSLLAFLPGKGEINRLAAILAPKLADNILLCTLYGDLSPAEQDKAIQVAPVGWRKVVLATNVAESSLTIEGITMVVDSGYQRSASFNPKTGVSKLSLARISQSSAIQRSGRAGRLSAGKALRLWSQEEQGRLLQVTQPEIVLSELTSVALDCACWGAQKFSDLALLTPAPKVNEQLAWQLLQQLELVDKNRKLTMLGREAHHLGCHPRLAHMLLQAKVLSQINTTPHFALLACLLATIVEARGLPAKGADISGYLSMAIQGQMGQQAKVWQKKMSLQGDLKQALSGANDYDIAHLLGLAYPDRIAKARGKLGFLLSNGTGVTLDPQDPLCHAPWLVVADFQETQGRNAGRVYLACALDERLINDELAHLVTTQRVSGWDDIKGRFFAETQMQLGSIVLKSVTDNSISADDIRSALVALVRQKGLSILNMDDNVKQLQLRVIMASCLSEHLAWPDYSDEGLMDSIEKWLTPYLTDVRNLAQLAKLDCNKLLLNHLSWELQQALNDVAPTRWLMATGTYAPIRYQLPVDEHGQAYFEHQQARAFLSVRLQEALGMAQSPRLFNGKLTVTMELLSPAQRPLATTADLASFWQGPYTEVKKEMRGRYPKHLWPDDPVNTTATKFTKKKTPGL
ncbi:ATP-dependent helicase HrpB [Shewanella holmiensis]|uniref:ATP-dependent helicase HrpB n=1 Tax=Shewanella holmiensis TaxID=2952222 RepID=A0A9X3ATP0_9GAMM|nr:ATP-dependent helicase HrpB [Shewanella holmiensis]MCT7940685.1 ATP-dependent helicase HrpB [Shewanella holmiensis]